MGAIIVSFIDQKLLLTHNNSIYANQIASGVIVSWSRTIYKQFELLAGLSAPRDFLHLITYNAMMFSQEITCIDTIRAYHVGIGSNRSYHL